MKIDQVRLLYLGENLVNDLARFWISKMPAVYP